jgi:hypothetical protein
VVGTARKGTDNSRAVRASWKLMDLALPGTSRSARATQKWLRDKRALPLPAWEGISDSAGRDATRAPLCCSHRSIALPGARTTRAHGFVFVSPSIASFLRRRPPPSRPGKEQLAEPPPSWQWQRQVDDMLGRRM